MAKAQAEKVNETGNTKKPSKAAADGSAPVEGSEGTGAPRPRKWNYGIAMENSVKAVPLADQEASPKLKAGEAEGYAMATKGCTVEKFLETSDRGILRRLSRKGLVNVVGVDGTMYPIDYVAPEKPAKKEKPAKGEDKAA